MAIEGLYTPEERQAKDELLKYSAVSRTWRQMTLPYLFHTVAMHLDLPIRSTEYQTPDIGLSDFLAFLAFVDFQSVTQNYIKELRLATLNHKVDDDMYQCNPTLLFTILRHLPRLRVLELQDVRLSSCEPQDLLALGPPIPLDRFYYGRTHRQNLPVRTRTMLSVLHSLASSELYLDGFYLRSDDPSESDLPNGSDIPLQLQPRSLSLIDISPIDKVISILLGSPSFASGALTSLQMVCLSTMGISAISDLVFAVRVSLVDITFSLKLLGNHLSEFCIILPAVSL